LEDLVKQHAERVLSLQVFTDMVFLPVATSFVEKGALSMGLGDKEAVSLTLAAEEIFSYLCRLNPPDGHLEIRCSGAQYYVQAELSCPVADFDMRLFNLTATVSPEDEASLEQMGLLIASRFVDRLHLKQLPPQGMLLALVKEKTYPAIDRSLHRAVKPLDRYTVRRPDPGLLKVFVELLNTHYPPRLFPKAFQFPGKVVDMVAGGEYEAVLAVGGGGMIGGGLVWHWASGKAVECFGPYLFGQQPGSDMSEALLEACIGAMARSPAVGLVNLYPTEELPKQHFEALGTLTFFDETGSGTPTTAYFRQMHEDPGTSSWCHPEMEAFLRREYDRLVLPREIQVLGDAGEARNPYSVLSADLDRSHGRVILHPLRSGRDTEENLSSHLSLFRNESIHNVFFMMDLGVAWQNEFTPALLRKGFTPRAVAPYFGEGDNVLFQLETFPA